MLKRALASPIEIYPASEADIATVIVLAHAIWPTAYVEVLTPEQIENMLMRIYTQENLRDEIASGHRFWIAYKEQTPVGYVSSYKDGDTVWIKKIYVDPSVKGQGIGSQLIDVATEAWLPAVQVKLLVNPNNKPAQAYYEYVGFSNIGTTPVKMGDWNFDDIIYARPII